MSRIYYAYHNFTDASGNDLSIGMQTRNYPELFQQVHGPDIVTIQENFIPNEKYIDGNRIGYLEISDLLIQSTGYSIEFISGILMKMGAIFNLYIVDDITTWFQNNTSLSLEEINRIISY